MKIESQFVEEYIERLMGSSFEGWTDKEKKGYLTACISIQEFIKKEVENSKPLPIII